MFSCNELGGILSELHSLTREFSWKFCFGGYDDSFIETYKFIWYFYSVAYNIIVYFNNIIYVAIFNIN